ncbi:MAG: glycosyltransferase [Planctomycetota bacterium]
MTRVAIVTPVLNDWESVELLISNLNKTSELSDLEIQVLCVDDGSTSVEFSKDFAFEAPISSVQVIRLQANQGHQRAVALGLAHAADTLDFDLVVVMDSDGEDRPEDVPKLIRAHDENPGSIIVAQRQRRSEGLSFRIFYQFYKMVFSLLTGRPISFGNFSLIPKYRLPNVLFNDGIWNNFAASILKSRIPISYIGTHRGTRYFGSSKMNFTSLMIHGLSAISVFTDVVVGRIISLLTASSVAVFVVVLSVVYMKFATTAFVPGYATNVILFAVLLLAVALFTGVMTILSLLANRQRAATYPSHLVETLIREIIEIPNASDNAKTNFPDLEIGVSRLRR